MTGNELRTRFLKFFEDRGHIIVLSSSLLPDDPSVLLTTAGMQQFKPYYGELDPEKTIHPSLSKPVGLRAVSVQKSFRTSDIDEVGDERHLTFFEMLGNFSFGGYQKKEAITLAYDFLVKELGLKIAYVTVFEGKESIGVPRDEESIKIWKSLDSTLEVREQGMEDVFWGPTGNSGPCGPTTEIYCKNGVGQDIEVWNIVFNQYFYPGSREELDLGVEEKKIELLKKPGVDTGMGLERLAMIAQQKATIFETDLFEVPILSLLRKRPEFQSSSKSERSLRIIADHLRGATFLISDGVLPSNKERGYILRRLIRRAITHSNYILRFPEHVLQGMTDHIVEYYGSAYPELVNNRQNIRDAFDKEQNAFVRMYVRGKRELDKKEKMTSQEVFDLYQTFGFPPEVTREFRDFDWNEFEESRQKHQEISRAGRERKFGGHGLLLDTGELKAATEEELKIVTRLHTATHLLQAALRKVLGEGVHQAGSDITAERTRFDFTFERKLTEEEVRKIEDLVNKAIQKNMKMDLQQVPFQEAVKIGALYSPKETYPDVVKVYSAMDPDTGEAFSKELCGGPHVKETGEIGKFTITKQESVGGGLRRIRGVIS